MVALIVKCDFRTDGKTGAKQILGRCCLATGDIINYNRRPQTFLCSSAFWTASECWWPPAVVFSRAPFSACSTITQGNIKVYSLEA